ncbi:MAG: radical SAM protein, partial [Clostridia bacterium]|nr:radical SAM protein [Clostridia bacterium]
AHYGRDLDGDIRLIDLLEEINKIEGLERIRIGSLEPRLLTEEFVDRLKKLEKMCHHFHLSLQSGCTETLKRMNRKYTKEDILELAKRLRENFEDAILTADIIVGFPRRNRRRIFCNL